MESKLQKNDYIDLRRLLRGIWVNFDVSIYLLYLSEVTSIKDNYKRM